MLNDMGQDIIRKIRWLNMLEKISLVWLILTVFAAVIIFCKFKIYHSIHYLSGMKRKKGIKKLKKDKEKQLFFIALMGLAAGSLWRDSTIVKSMNAASGNIILIKNAENAAAKENAGNIALIKNAGNMSVKNNIENITIEEQVPNQISPKLFLHVKAEPEISSSYSDMIFYKENCLMTFQIQEKNFNQKGEFERLFFQLVEGKNKEEYRTQTFDFSNFTKESQKEDVFEKEFDLNAETGEEIFYKFILEYSNDAGNVLIADEEKNLEKYGKLKDGVFESKKVVIDKNAPVIENNIELKPLKNQNRNKEMVYYDKGVEGIIKIHEKYFCNEQVTLFAIPLDEAAKKSVKFSENADTQGNLIVSGWQYENVGDNLYYLTFRFEEQGKWRLAFSCKDAALNESVVKGNEQLHWVYSEDFVVDGMAPIVSVHYENYNNINSAVLSPEKVNQRMEKDLKKIVSSECEIFARKDMTVALKIVEDYFSPEDIILHVFENNYDKKKEKEVTHYFYTGADLWEKKTEREFILKCVFSKEGHYRIQLEYEDYAGNKMLAEKNSETETCMQKGVYKSPMCTVDKTPPVIKKFEYDIKPSYKSQSRLYFVRKPKITIKIEEENFHASDFSLEDRAISADGNTIEGFYDEEEKNLLWTSYYENGKRINQTTLNVTKEANHTFMAEVIDGGGYQVSGKKEEITYDETKPYITYSEKNDKTNDIVFGVQGEKKSACTWLKYNTYQYFSKKKVLVMITAHDEISGVKAIHYYYTDYNGKRIKNSVEKGENPGKDVKKEDLSTYRVYAMVDKDNFKGYLHVIAEDYGGIQSRQINCKGMISESAALHKENSSVSIELPKAKYTDEKNKLKYYNSTIAAKVFFEDNYSGIYKTCILAKKHNDYDRKGTVLQKKKGYGDQGIITYAISEVLKIPVNQFSVLNKNSAIKISAKMTDNVGNQEKSVSSVYNVILDDNPPEISVKYNNYNAKNKKYYNKKRIAKIKVKDWNFNPLSVRWEITGSNKNYRISEWKQKGENHWCKVIFNQDGEDYKIKLSAADYAGNQTIWDEDSEFTIDKTPPEISMKLSRKNVRNEYYYRSPRTIFFQIKERNLREKDVQIHVRAFLKGKKVSLQKPETFYTKNNYHYTSVVYKKDGNYYIYVSCKDLAGNRTVVNKPLRFVIDQTAPVISVHNLEHKMAYNGKVAPEMVCNDINLDTDTLHVEIMRSNGKAIGKERYPFQKKPVKNGWKIQWKDFPYEEWADDIYTLKAEVEDYAGNKTSLGKGIRFSVNRFGSVYILEPEMKYQLESGYLNQEKDICIKEISVNPIDSQIVLLKDNQKREELKEVSEEQIAQREAEEREGKYIVSCRKTTKKADGKSGWYERQYRICKENFLEEGMYQVTIYSKGYIFYNGKKQIIKEITNELKNQPIKFAVDKTPPIVQIGGLEQKIYDEKSHLFTITVLDNFQFSHMNIKIHYEDGRKADKNIKLTSEDFDVYHNITRELSAYNGYQTVSYIAWDKAGNYVDSTELGRDKKVLVTTNRIVRTYYNKPVFYQCILGGIIVFVLGICILKTILIDKNRKASGGL